MLAGQAKAPTVKRDAEARVKRIERVEEGVNLVEVLPSRPSDDSLWPVAHPACYGQSFVSRRVHGTGFTAMGVWNSLREVKVGVPVARITKLRHNPDSRQERAPCFARYGRDQTGYPARGSPDPSLAGID